MAVPRRNLGNVGNTTPSQGAALAASSPNRTAYGISSRVARELGADAASKPGDFKDPLGLLPYAPNRTPNPKTGQFVTARLLVDLGNLKDQVGRATSSQELDVLQRRMLNVSRELTRLGIDSSSVEGLKYDPKPAEYYTSGEYTGSANITSADIGVSISANLTDIPTSTTNFRRPRTVAAGYDPENRIVTVIFRDGTAWNYYGVPSDAWLKFSNSITKGPFLNDARHNKGRGDGDLLTYAGHGPADITQLSPEAQTQFYRLARTAQVISRDKVSGSTQQNRRPKATRNLIKAQNVASNAKAARKRSRTSNKG